MKLIAQIICIIICFFYVEVGYCQKKSFTWENLDEWAQLTNTTQINSDGSYVQYEYTNASKGINSLVIKGIGFEWERAFVGGKSLVFSNLNKRAFLLLPNDTLCIVNLGGADCKKIANVTSFQVVCKDEHDWLITRTRDQGLKLEDVDGTFIKYFKQVTTHYFGIDGASVLVNLISEKFQELHYFNLESQHEEIIWKSKKISNVIYHGPTKMVAFIDEDSRKLLLYSIPTKKIVTACSNIDTILQGFTFQNLDRFNDFGKGIVFYLKLRTEQVPEPTNLKLWSTSNDSWKMAGERPRSSFACILNVDTKKVIILQKQNESFKFYGDESQFGVAIYQKGDLAEGYWNKRVEQQRYAVDCETGDRQPIDIDVVLGSSNRGNIIAGYSRNSPNLMFYNFSTRKTITNNSNILQSVGLKDDGTTSPFSLSKIVIAEWTPDDNFMLFCDEFDVWKVSTNESNYKPICITQKAGQNSHIAFRPFYSKYFDDREVFFLTAFDKVTMQNGFYRLECQKQTFRLLKLNMGDFYYHTELNKDYKDLPFFKPLKSKGRDVWVLKRQDQSTSPNLFSTSDFLNFYKVSNVHPEKEYKTMTNDLLNFRMNNGRIAQGLLFKPFDFDSTKRYPVIVHFYEKMAQLHNVFLPPAFAADNLNIQWFVNNGYLVFTPDIYYTVGNIGESSYNHIVTATEFISNFKFVDKSNLGIQGHSLGAFETLYTVSHCNLFKAAMAACAPSDILSWYGSLRGNGEPLQSMIERGQFIMNCTPWESKDKFLNNSVILNCDKISSPLLLMYNDKDGIIPFSQGVELFIALRRLKKEAYLLQYIGEAHSLSNKKNQLDYTIKLGEYFDYYLKGKNKPKWIN